MSRVLLIKVLRTTKRVSPPSIVSIFNMHILLELGICEWYIDLQFDGIVDVGGFMALTKWECLVCGATMVYDNSYARDVIVNVSINVGDRGFYFKRSQGF